MLYKPMETFGFIYKITNLLNGKIYIGQTTQRPAKRWTGHKSSGANPKWPIHRAIARHGADAFRFEVIEECADRAALDAAECRWISELGCKKPIGYNVTDGGGGAKGYRFSKEHCVALGNRMRGRFVSPETGWKISESKRGHKFSEETRKRMSLSHIGLKRSPETCAKIAAAQRGKKLSAAHIEKMRLARTGFRHTDEAKAKLCRRVIAEGVEYPSVSAAAQALATSIATIYRRIKFAHEGYSSLDPMKTRRAKTAEQIERHRRKVSKPVVIDGNKFASVTIAAAAFGMTRQALIYRLKAGYPGHEYLDAA